MKWFKNLKVGYRLVLGFSIMILFMGIIGYAGYNSVKNINKDLGEIFTVRLPSIDYLVEADRDLQQLLVAERSMIFANAKSDVFKTLIKDYEVNLKQADERWEKYKSLSSSSEEKAIIPKYEEAREAWKTISKKVVDGRRADTRQGRREALDLTLGIAKEKFEEMRDYIDQLTGINLSLAKKAREEASATYRSTLITLLSIIGFGLLIGIFLMWSISRGVTKPLRGVIEGLAEASEQVASGSDHVSASSQKLAEGASEQAASIEETSSSLEEMSSMTRQNAGNATQADNLMKEGNKVVKRANTSMDELTRSMEDISKASEETSKIIKTIDEIAFQTNLLALNAAVEAARAGEAGAGFAVVADEVRNLAMRAAEAAGNTADLIEGTVKKIKDGSDLVATTSDAFTEVATSVSKVGELVGEIAAASNEQAQGIGQVNTAVTEMDKVVQENAANAEESASASEEMSAQAEQMKGFVGELVALVEGSKNGAEQGRQPRMKALKTFTKRAVAAPEKADGAKNMAAAIHKVKEVNPDQVIPMDDEDFKDF
jgi:methyl-accepting chemotaxis protein